MEDRLARLEQVIDQIRSIDRETITRPDFGSLSYEKKLAPHLDALNKKMDFMIEYGHLVHDSYINGIINLLNDDILPKLRSISTSADSDYPNEAEGVSVELIRCIYDIAEHWPPFITAAIEKRGFLEDEDIRTAYSKFVEDMKKRASDSVEEIVQKSEEAINNARELAEQIETKARRTATGISLEDVQNQFKAAQTGLNWQVGIWAFISVASIAAFVWVAIYLWFQEIPDTTESIIYYTAIRLTALAALGTIAAFSLRVLRAHMHMRQHNLHRQRVANSMEAFVQSGETEQHRGVILSYLVQSVADFGVSGLVQDKDDHLTASRLIIDPVTKIISPDQGK